MRYLAIAACASLSLASCSGGHGSPVTPVAVATSVPAAPQGANLVAAVFAIEVPIAPAATPNATRRAPAYVSANTKSVKIALNSPPAGYVQPAVVNITGPISATCPVDAANPGDYKCTVGLFLPPGSDSLTVTTYAASGATGSILSQQTQTFAVAVGTANALSMTLDANVATLGLTGNAECQVNGAPIGNAAVVASNAAELFTVSGTDPSGATIVGPGLPALAVNGHTSAFTATAVNGSQFAVGFPQAGQVGIAATSSADHVALTFAATPPSTTDGLSFNVSKAIDFATGAGLAGHSTIAYATNSVSTGAIAFTAVQLPSGSGASVTFSNAPTNFTRTASSTQSGVFDVDHPASLVFDKTGDLLVANGGSGSADAGNLACVPSALFAGNLGTVADSETVSIGIKNPVGIAYDARDNSVAIANGPASAANPLVGYVQSAPFANVASRNGAPVGGEGATAVADLANLTAGTYAVALTTGTPKAPNGTGSSQIAVVSPDGTRSSFTDATIDDPTGLAFDATNNQLAIGSSSPFESTLDFYSVTASSATQQKTIALANGLTGSIVAASADGHVAVGGPAGLAGLPQIQVYGNTTARPAVGGPIPFNGTTTSCGTTYIYDTAAGGTVVLDGLTWLDNTRLLVSLQSGNAAKQGLYVFDISSLAVPAGFDDNTCGAFVAAPVQVGFLQTSSAPLSTAYLP